MGGLKQAIENLEKRIEAWVADIRSDIATAVKSLTDVQSLLDKDEPAAPADEPAEADDQAD